MGKKYSTTLTEFVHDITNAPISFSELLIKAFDDMKEQGLRLIPFSDDVYEWKACMITRKEEAENEAVQCFLQFIQEWIGKIKSGEIIRQKPETEQDGDNA